jgi:hypothetical protein
MSKYCKGCDYKELKPKFCGNCDYYVIKKKSNKNTKKITFKNNVLNNSYINFGDD